MKIHVIGDDNEMKLSHSTNSERRTISDYILRNSGTLAESILQMQFEKMNNLLKTYTPYMREKCLEDIRYHLQALADAIATDSQDIFIDYISWAQFLLENLNIDKEQLITNLQCMEAVLNKALNFESVISKIISAAIEKLKSGYQEKFSESFITQDNKYKELASEYIKTVFDGRRKDASNLIMDTFKKGVPIRDIYTYRNSRL